MAGSWFNSVAQAILALIQPITLLWLGLILLTLGLWWKRHLRFAALSGLLLAYVQAVGGTNLTSRLLGTLERPYTSVKFAELPECDAVVLLGGGVEPSPLEIGHIHLTTAGDRLVSALELMRLGKARALCVSGGSSGLNDRSLIEADLVKKTIEERHLTSAPVFSFGARLDTHDEALYLRQLAQEQGWKRFLLVTSASHMRRAAATFRGAGLDVVPAPCNFLTTMGSDAEPPTLGLPGHLGFIFASIWLHEEIGWFEYRRRGWITVSQ